MQLSHYQLIDFIGYSADLLDHLQQHSIGVGFIYDEHRLNRRSFWQSDVVRNQEI